MQLLQDLRYGYRTLSKNPGFTAVAVLSLALGIGANTAIFSFLNTVLLRDLPVSHPESLVSFGEDSAQGMLVGPPDSPMELFSWTQYQSFLAGNKVFDGVLAFNSMFPRLYVTLQGLPEQVRVNLVSGNYFDVLGVKPSTGHLFDDAVDRNPGSAAFIVLNDSYWQSRFNRSPAVIGQTVRLAGRAWTIVGAAPPGFFGTRLGVSPDIWIPLSMQDQMPGFHDALTSPLTQFLQIIARLKPGVTAGQAGADVNLLYQRMLPGELPPGASPRDLAGIKHAAVRVTPASKGLSDLREKYNTALGILMVVVAMVLAIACANVANLLLALASKRQKEFAVRIAMGAGAWRVIRQQLTESVLLSACGGLLGILLASAGGRLLLHLISTGPRAIPLTFDLDGSVLAFTVLISLATGLLFGLAPAIRASRSTLNASLRRSRTISFGRALVAGQVALSLCLLVAAGLLLHTFSNLISLPTGFSRENVLLFKLDTDSAGYGEDQRLASLYRRLEDNVSRQPGVGAEGISMLSFHEGGRTDTVSAPGVNLPESERETDENFVSPGYFSTLRIPVLLGRGIESSDSAAAIPVAVISESLAKKIYGGGARALGQTVTLDGEKKQFRVVGIAGNIKIESMRDRDTRVVWRSIYQSPVYIRNLAVRVTGDPIMVASGVRKAILDTDSNLPIRWTTTMAAALDDSLGGERAVAELSAFFAALALLLAGVGLYGTISFTVAGRTSEIGIRMALGAERVGVAGMVLRDALTLTGAGVAIGLPMALLATRLMRTMLYGIGTIDAVSIAGAVAVLSVVAAFAGYLPARRAAAVDPMVALRYE